MNDKKPRKAIVNFHIEQGDSVEGLWDEKKQIFSLRVIRDGKTVSAKQVQLATLYNRSKKPKILNEIYSRRSSEFTVSQSETLQKYAQIWAIDTNQRGIFGEIAHVSAVTVCSTDGSEQYYPVLAIIFGKTKGNPELYGWRKFIEFVQASDLHNAQHRYGLVVDSEYSKIYEFNNRNLPIHGNFYLPDNWDLIYATSDSGKEYIFNKIIAVSDKTSSAVLELISGKESNVKHWAPITDEEQHLPSYLGLLKSNT